MSAPDYKPDEPGKGISLGGLKYEIEQLKKELADLRKKVYEADDARRLGRSGI